MKKLLLLSFAFSGLLTQLSAQATLTNDNTSPKPGDSYLSQPAVVTGVPILSGGANQIWNYSNLVDSGTAIGFQAVLPSATPFADSFPGSNVTIKTAGDSVFSYFNASSSALLLYGVGVKEDSDSSVFRYNPARTYLPYPFTYNSSFTDSVSTHFPGFDLTFNGADTITGDGYGSLSVPGRTFSNVLRVIYIEDLTGSTTIAGFPNTTKIRTISYLYYSPDIHAPVLTYTIIQTTTTTSFGGNDITTSRETRSIEYLKAFILPVTFQSFRASLQNKEIDLQWNTAQEINTDHFTIQRSLTGRDFQDVATVTAKGNTQGSTYTYTDKNFAYGSIPSVVYYRIRSTDKDGKIVLSEVAVVRGDNVVVIGVYPNPATNYIRIVSKENSAVDLISIYDAKGSLVQQLHNFSVSQPIYIAALAKGNYVVKVTIGTKTISSTIIKQ